MSIGLDVSPATSDPASASADASAAGAARFSNAPTPIRGGRISVKYLYAWAPLAVVGIVAVLALPWLGLIALLILGLGALAALAALAWAVVAVPLAVGRAIGRRWRKPVHLDHPRAALDERALVTIGERQSGKVG
jgi:hypothetical protein